MALEYRPCSDAVNVPFDDYRVLTPHVGEYALSDVGWTHACHLLPLQSRSRLEIDGVDHCAVHGCGQSLGRDNRPSDGGGLAASWPFASAL